MFTRASLSYCTVKQWAKFLSGELMYRLAVMWNQLRDSAIQRDNQQKYAIELDRRRLLLCEGSLALDDPVQELKIFVLL